jgi:uncharacterized LabA/DUF88 family protein
VTTQPTQPENNDTQVTVVADSSAPDSPSNAAENPASTQNQDNPPSLFAPEAPAPSFTALVEEFRQREERMALQGAEPTETRGADVQKMDAQGVGTQGADAMNRVPTRGGNEQADSAEPGKADDAATAPAAKPHRLVPPPLRPATRIRVPRQGGRQRETFVTQASPASANPVPAPSASTPTGDVEHQATASTPAIPTSEEPSAPVAEAVEQSVIATTPDTTAQEAQVEQTEQSKPARRYRFDRREPAARAAVSSKPVSLAPSPAEPAGVRPRQENTAPEQSAKPANGSIAEVPSPAAKPEPEPVITSESEAAAPIAPGQHSHNDRRRRHGQESQHTKAQASIEAIKDAVKAEPVRQADVTRQTDTTRQADVTRQAADQPVAETPADATPLEDLPPLEYSELQAASRRRRRRRTGSNGVTPAPAPANKPVTPASASALSPLAPAPIAPVSPVTPARAPNVPQTPYTIQSGITVSQMNQGNDMTGPFQGPDPSPARGSVFPTQPRLTRSMRNGNEAQRGSMAPLPSARSSDGILSVGAVNHLANVISQAIQTQSDRMVAELRRGNQAPANVSVTLPPFPSTERVGVFVDVANLLYSARTLRTTIDFGKLLDFLRGNRRLVRAHAYCPTSPQPGDDQMFLQAVKGLGYRITTKNYKTFASGAKKADMDLDLCMDVVRLVDGKAVDCIVLVSGDSDFIPLLDYCSDHGVRVEVVAFDESMSASLRQSCDLFINLSMLDEIRVS